MRDALALVRCLGPGWVLWRVRHAVTMKTGLLRRRFPTTEWDALDLAALVHDDVPTVPAAFRAYRTQSQARFFFAPGQLPDAELLARTVSVEGRARTLAVADDYCRGRFLYYSHHAKDLGWPVDWLLNPFSGGRHNADAHWVDYATFSPQLADIKDVWEPSRFACAFWLVRAYALTGDEKYPRAFWELFESWCAQNPVNRGPNWKCGQEIALRTMAWTFALYGFWNSAATTSERIVAMARMVGLQAERIARNIDYAVSLKNNHSLSEAAGLLTVGLLFPEFKRADAWRRLGRDVLEREVARQIYDDGSYVQHSMTYHRVMLHDCLWAVRLCALNGQPLSAALTSRVALAGEFLFEMLDLESGDVPNYGANDGALVLPLSACDYRDFRPTVQAVRFLADGRRALDGGLWDEMGLWLFGADALAGADAGAGEKPRSRRFDAGGYYTIRGPQSWCMVRCHRYRDRPAHVDMLHLDLWWRGVNVLGDSGTYRYFAADDPILERYFKDIAAHNTIEIDGAGPLRLFSRFLWLPWPGGRCVSHDPDGWTGEHDAYTCAPWRVVHHRDVRRMDDESWVVHDRLEGDGEHDVVLRWQMADGDVSVDEQRGQVSVGVAGGSVSLRVEGAEPLRMRVCRGERKHDCVGGWESRYYGQYTARPTIEYSGRFRLPIMLETRIECHTACGDAAGMAQNTATGEAERE
ncbi:MAG: alginate lyase family protein [Phycisphaerae bacterium]|nr:alginate lyase family protein [Phycisphaerae bacterium]